MRSSYQEVVDKIDVEDLIKDFKVLNLDNFTAYLKEVWRVILFFNIGPCTKK
jgi:hypothetical protein